MNNCEIISTLERHALSYPCLVLFPFFVWNHFLLFEVSLKQPVFCCILSPWFLLQNYKKNNYFWSPVQQKNLFLPLGVFWLADFGSPDSYTIYYQISL